VSLDQVRGVLRDGPIEPYDIDIHKTNKHVEIGIERIR
jgi:hypothetical protein